MPTIKTYVCKHEDYDGLCCEEHCPLKGQIIYERFSPDCFYRNTILGIESVTCLEYEVDGVISYIPFNAETKKADFAKKTTEKTEDLEIIGRLRKIDKKFKVKIYKYCSDCIHLCHIPDSLKNLSRYIKHKKRCIWHNVGRNPDSSACRDHTTEKYPGEKAYHERKKRNEETRQVQGQVKKT